MWDFFDRIIIITLTSSTERINKIKENFKKTGIRKYDFFYSAKIENKNNLMNQKNININSILRNKICDDHCVLLGKNHMSIIKKAYDENINNLLIFEDDAEFELPLNKKKLKSVFNWLKTNKIWDLFYFGYSPWLTLMSKLQNKNIVQLYKPLLTHSYAINRQGMEKILKYKYNNINFDNFLANSNLNKFAIFPAICYQNEEPKASKYLNNYKFFSLLKKEEKFNKYMKFLEYFSVILPFFIIFIIILIIIIIILKYKMSKK